MVARRLSRLGQVAPQRQIQAAVAKLFESRDGLRIIHDVLDLFRGRSSNSLANSVSDP